MKKLILTAVLIVLGLNVGCRMGCTPYDNCGPVFANPFNCTPNHRSGSAFNGATTTQGAVEKVPAPAQPAATPATTPTNDSFIPSAQPAPSATPAALPTTSYNRPDYRTNQQSFQTSFRTRYQQR